MTATITPSIRLLAARGDLAAAFNPPAALNLSLSPRSRTHLEAVHDGTERSPQKQDHETYKVRDKGNRARLSASQLIYLAAMRRVPRPT